MSHRELAAAILYQSAKDKVSSDEHVDLEAFWRSGWFQGLCHLVDLDPVAVREHMQKVEPSAFGNYLITKRGRNK